MESINNGVSSETPRMARPNDPYETVVSELVSVIAKYENISVEQGIQIVSEFYTIVDPARKPGKHFVWASLVFTKEPTLMFLRRGKREKNGNYIKGLPYLLPLEVWGNLVISDKVTIPNDSNLALKGQLRCGKRGRFFLALDLDRQKSPAPWPHGFFVKNDMNFVKKIMEKREAAEMEYFISQATTDERTKELLIQIKNMKGE
ncbi:MAG: hypothetical protein QXP38_02480 [Nitrososphaerota archaeon]